MVIQAAAIAAGRALMSAGSRMAGSVATRSAASQGLKTGVIQAFETANGKKVAMNIKDMMNYSKKSSISLKKIEKTSPALSQQMIIFRKSFGLLFRSTGDIIAKVMSPFNRSFLKFALSSHKITTKFYNFAYKNLTRLLKFIHDIAKFLNSIHPFLKIIKFGMDILGKFLKPMARWMIRFAMKYFATTGQGSATGRSEVAIDDMLDQLRSSLTGAQALGDVDAQARIQRQIDKWEAVIGSAIDNTKEYADDDTLNDIFGELINGAFNLSLAFSKVGDVVGDIINNLTPGGGGGGDGGGGGGGDSDENEKGFWAKVAEKIEGWLTTIWNDYLSPMWTIISDWATFIWDNYMKPGWEIVKEWAAKIWKDYILPGWETAKNWGQKLWDAIFQPLINTVKKLINKIFPGTFPEVEEKVGGKFGGAGATGSWGSDTNTTNTGTTQTNYVGTGSVIQSAKAIYDKAMSGVSDFFGGLKGGYGNRITGTTATGSHEALLSGSSKDYQRYKTIEAYIKQVESQAARYGNPLSKATGGDINQSGLYNLHAGERVMNAGDTARMNMGNTNNFTNKITINNPRIANNMDIRMLARELAKFQERELRRRVSYV
jgi:hypothetical protein